MKGNDMSFVELIVDSDREMEAYVSEFEIIEQTSLCVWREEA